jgi:hypothetical protein
MSEDTTFAQVQRISSEILSGQEITVVAHGENYYAFAIVSAKGIRSTLPPVWVEPQASDLQVRTKLSREFRRAFDPDADPDDLSIPGLQNEGKEEVIARSNL